MQIITVANEPTRRRTKTTTATHLAHGLSRKDAQVLLVDLDQGACSMHLGLDPAPGLFDFFCQGRPLASCIRATTRIGLHLLPGNSYTRVAEREADRLGTPLDLLLLEIARLTIKYDYIVIDAHSHTGGYFQEVALWMADLLIIPTPLDAMALDSVHNTIGSVQSFAAREGTAPPAIMMLPQFHRGTSVELYNHGLLEESFYDNLLAPIPFSPATREAISLGLTSYEHQPATHALHAYEQIVNQIRLTDLEVLFAETDR